MKIAGLQKLTLLDFPDKTAATVFTFGCDFRCPFCHNIDLVVPYSKELSDQSDSYTDLRPAPIELISEEEIFSLLEKRHGLLDGVCITGGEPTLQHDLADICKRIKDMGYLVKLDTNGSRPNVLHDLIAQGFLDYVAMDIKNCPQQYADTIGLADPRSSSPRKNADEKSRSFDLMHIEESMRILLKSAIPFEFRTTTVRELHSKASLIKEAEWIAELSHEEQYPIEDAPWFIQQFVDSENVIAGEGVFSPWKEDDLRAVLPELQAILPKTSLRGI